MIGCTKMDHYYKDYLEKAEMAYPGRPDSIVVMPGYKRVKLSAFINSDPRIRYMRVSWNNDADYVEASISAADYAKRKYIDIPSLPEGDYTFSVRTYDETGRASMASEAYSPVYGDIYVSSLNNRVFQSTGYNIKGEAQITYVPESTANMLGVLYTYTTVNNETIQRVDTASSVVILDNYKLGTPVTYRTAYKPGTNALDTFYAPARVLEKMPDPVLKNAGPYTASFSTGGIGILNDWITNDAAKNFNGDAYGGYLLSGGISYMYLFSGTIFNGALHRNIVNGKIYQNIPLAAGEYELSIAPPAQPGAGTHNNFLVVSLGGDLPDTESLASALAYVPLQTAAVRFTLDSQQVVSMGVLANLSGNASMSTRFFTLQKLN